MKISILRPSHSPSRSSYGVLARALCTSAFVVGLIGAAQAQNVTVNPGAGSYATLKDAVDAINLGTHTGAITVSIVADTTETASSVLNASGTLASSYTSILITPSGARTISGGIVAGSPLLDLNGADGVTINGLNTGGNALTIANTTASATAGTSTIRFINDATGNTIQNATINGAGTATVTGTLLFGIATTTGNDNNTISGCNIGPAGATFPTVGINSIGTTTSLVTRNSGIQVTNSNIFDFYNVGGVVSTGILATGSSDWIITGNSFYQTASRTMATGSGFIGVSLADTLGVNFNVSNNFVGGSAASAGATAWTQTGATTHTFIGIRLSVGTATASSVQNNVVRNIAVSTSSTSTINAGISAVGGSINVGNIAGNTIGSSTVAGSITWVGGATGQVTGILAGTGTPGVMAISNNTIGGFTITGAGATSFRAISLAGAATSYVTSANTIGSATLPNSITNSSNGLVAGIASASASTSVNISNNLIANLSTTGVSTGNLMIGILASAGNNTITGNTIRNFTSSGIATGTGATPSFGGIVLTGSAAGQTVSQNTIHSANNSAATAAVTLTGIYWSNGSNSAATNIIERNFVHSLATTSTGAAILNGIYTFNGGASFRNNMIRLGLNAAGTDLTSAALIINGIQSDTLTTATNNWYFNSVYIGGSGVSTGAATTSGFKRLTSDITDFRNNIVVNNRSNGAGTGKHYVMNLNATTTVTSNANAHLHTGVGAVFGVVGVVDSATFAAWRTATSLDTSSFFSDPMFLNPTGTAATVDLHINPGITTVIEGNGVALAAPTDDFDGQVRASLTPVDIGADAGNFMGIDLSAPAISYVPLSNTSLVVNRVIAVNITDLTGVAGGANAPRIYFRKGAGSYFSTQCTGAAPNYSCTIDNTLIGGVVTTDVIGYFVIAQDTIGSVGANPGGGLVATDVNTVTTPPTTPNSYTIVPAAAGTINVGSGETITSLTNTGGLFAVINGSVLTSNIVVNITSDLIAETGAVALNQIAEKGVGNYSLTISPVGARTVSGSVATPMLDFNGADRVTIDGLNAGSNSLLIRNTGAGSAIRFINDASNNILRNTTVEGTGTLVAIASGITTGNDNIQVTNNTIRDRTDAVGVPLNGIGSTAASTTILNSGLIISNNRMINFTQAGIFVGVGTENITLSQNEIFQTAARPSNISGILVNGMFGTNLISQNFIRDLTTSTTFTVNGMSLNDARSTTISRNRIFFAPTDAAATGAITGIVFNGSSTGAANLTVLNNMITIIPTVTSAQQVRGVLDFAFAGNTFTADYNSVYIGGVASGSVNSWGLFRANAAPTVFSARNNLVFNNRTGGTGNHFAGGDQSANTGTFVSNYNFFAGTGAVAANFMDYGTALTGTPVSFASYQAGPPTRDANSIAGVASGFVPGDIFVDFATGDLHLKASAPSVLNGGTPVATVVDIDNDPRSATAPEIGADELPTYTVGGMVSGLGGTGLVLQNNLGNNLNITANGSFTFTQRLDSNAAYSVTVLTQPGTPTQTCTVSNGSGTIVAANVTNIAVSCTTNTYTVGGSVSGLTGTGLVLSNNAGDNLSISANGAFTFATPVASGATYAVTVFTQPAGPTQTCSVSNGSGTIGAGNVTNVSITCSANSFTVGGSVSGLTGTGLVLHNNGGDSLAISANGTFTFATPVSSGATYAVTVLTQPGSPTQTCSVSNGNGTIGAANVTNVSVACVVNNTAPSIVTAGDVVRRAGSAASISVIAEVNDAQQTPASLTVTASIVPAGLTVNGIANNTGTVSASVAAACSATVGANTVGLSVSDGALSTAGNLIVNVEANSAPVLGTYAATAIATAGSAAVTPSAAPTDNGSVVTLTAAAPGFTGTFTGNPGTGVISISGAAPASVTPYVVTVTATDNCGLVSTRTFNLTVSNTANLDVSKDNGVTTYRAGDLLVYTLVLRNLGPDSANGTVFTDTVPATLVGATWMCAAANGAVCPQTSGSGSINATIATLPATGRLTYTLQANVATPTPAQISNTARVSITGLALTDPQLANNSATDTDLPESIFANGFEDTIVLMIDKTNGQQNIALSNLASLLDDTARIVFSANDVNGEALRVYGRINDAGEVELALALRNADGLLRLGAWQRFTSSAASISYTALQGANGFVLQSARFE